MSNTNGAAIERVIAMGDLEALRPVERVQYYQGVCESLGLNALTQPFSYIKLQGKLTLYAKKDTTDQLRKIHEVSIRIVARELDADGVYTVTARASMPNGREDESTGSVYVAGKKGEDLANAKMKAETKAKRRATLSICGLGWLDETEVQDVRGAKHVQVTDDGEIVEAPPAQLPAPAPATAEDEWLEWALLHTAAMNSAKTPGAMKEAFAIAYREAKAKNAPANIIASLEAAKDKLKAQWAT